ncbi:MAG TPA: type II secretion system F family protein [Terriglobia bacterium]|nr:type II secretion system F family protein [Terriglobia bacterium]
MYPVLLFILLLLLTFAVIVWVLKPTKPEADVQRHLRLIGSMYTIDADGTTILKQETLSSIPWLNALLAQVPGCSGLRLFIIQAGSTWTVSNLLFGSLLLALLVASVGGTLIALTPFALLVGVAAGIAPYGYLAMKRAARLRRFDTLLPESIDLMSRALRAGHGVISAIEMVSQEITEPVASEFRIVFEEQSLGLPIREAVLNLAQRVPLDDVQFLATAILVQKETGGNLAEVLDKTAAVMRERIRLKGQLRIYSAQGRVTAWVLCMLPFIVFLLINLVNHDYEKALWQDPLGRHLLYTGLIMMALGVFTIRKIIDIKV